MRRLVASLILASCSPGAEPTRVGAGAESGSKGATLGLRSATSGATAATSTGDAATPTTTVASAPRTCTLADPNGSCCDRDFGVDIAALQSACGFDSYVGEFRAPTACQLRFQAAGKTVALSVGQFRGRSFDQAVAHHMRGFFGTATGDGIERPGLVDGIHYSGDGNRGWAFVPGWSAPRRVAWGQAACSQAALQPVLAGMRSAPESPVIRAAPTPAAGARPLPPGTHEGAEASLLAKHATADAVLPQQAPALPDHSKRLIVVLLQELAGDRVLDLRSVVHADARWGLPDRRELRSNPVFDGDGGRRFADALRGAASRFAAESKFSCPPLSPQGSAAAKAGEWPMYCYFQSADQLDMLVFKLSVIGGRAGIEYIGLFETRPTAPTRADGEPPAPPIRPSDAKRAEAAARRGPRGPVPLPPAAPNAPPTPAPGTTSPATAPPSD